MEENRITWERRFDAASSVEVSTAGFSEYSALRAKFAPGTVIGRHDVSGLSIETVYQDIVKRSGKGLPPARDSYLYREGDTSADREDFSYYEGYLPLWTIWAEQNPDRMDNLREMLSDGVTVLTDRYARTEVSQARALADILNGEGHGFNPDIVGDYFTRKPEKPVWDLSERYDLMTVGMGRRQLEDFLQLIPPGTRKVVDTRNWTQNNKYPHFNRVSLAASLKELGIDYEWAPALAGRAKKGEEEVCQGGDLKRTDYDRYMDLDRASRAYGSLLRDIRSGGVVVVSGEENPSLSSRALMLGQRLERQGFSVGHVRGPEGGVIRIDSQTDTVLDALRGDVLMKGRSCDIDFFSDRSYRTGGNVEIRRRELPGNSEQERLLPGIGNYGTRIEVTVHTTYNDRTIEPARKRRSAAKEAEIHKEVMRTVSQMNAEWADYTIVFSNTAHEIPKFSLEGNNAMRVRIPTGANSAELLRDPATADRLAERISDNITRHLTARSWREGDFSLNSIRLNVVGSHISSMANQYFEESVSEEELMGQHRARLIRTGMSLEDRTGVTQEDINDFVGRVIEAVGKSGHNMEFELDGETHSRTWRIGEIRTNGETGVAEAATLASQRLGLRTSIGTGEAYRQTLDNETLSGLGVSDRAMMLNKFNLGLRRDVTEEDIAENLDMEAYMRREQEMHSVPGLSDRQVLVLQELGYGNTAIVEIQRLAVENGVMVTDDDALADLAENAAGYGIEGADYVSPAVIASAGRRVDEYLHDAAAAGYGVVTVASSRYPSALSVFTDYGVKEEKARYEFGPDGTASVVTSEEDARRTAPAVLWYRGAGLDVVDGSFVSVLADETPMAQTEAAARSIGSRAAGSKIGVAAVLDGTASVSAASEAAARGGLVIAVSEAPIDAEENATVTEDIVRKGGVVFSETGPGRNNRRVSEGSSRSENRARAKMLCASLSQAAVIVDGTKSSWMGAAINVAPRCSGDVTAVSYDGLGRISDYVEKRMLDINTEANRELKKQGVRTVGVDGEGFSLIADSVEAALDRGAEPAEDPEMAVRHPSQLPVDVIHYGGEHVFLVDARFPDVIETIRREYGEAARIESPKDRERIMDAFDHRERLVAGRPVRAFEGYEGTQIQERESWTERMFYYRGHMETLLSASGETLGLPSRETRLEQRRLFERIRSAAEEIRLELNRSAGIETDRAVHYETALHPVIFDNRIDLRCGSDTVARARLSDKGVITVENLGRLSDSLREHAVRDRNIFNLPSSVRLDDRNVDALCCQMSQAVLGTVIDERWSVGTREEIAEMQQRLEQGFDTAERDNLDIAVEDAGKARGLAEAGEKEMPCDVAYAHAHALVTGVGKRLSDLDARLKETSDRIHGLKSVLNESEGITDEKKESLKEDILRQTDTFRSLASEKEKALTDLVKLEAVRGDIALSSRITVTGGKLNADIRESLKAVETAVAGCAGKSGEELETAIRALNEAKTLLYGSGVSLSVDGRAVELPGADGRLAPDPAEARRLCADERAALCDTPLEKVAVAVSVSPDGTSAEQAVKKTSEHTPDRNFRVLEESNGILRVEKGGMMAYADRSLNVISDYYRNLSPFGRTVGIAVRDDGKRNLIDRSGAEISPVWFDQFFKPSEGVVMIKDGEMYNHVNLQTHGLVSEQWAPAARSFHEGYAAIQGGPEDGPECVGKYNYINLSGELMTGTWYDYATDFSNGVASVVLDGREGVIRAGTGEFKETPHEDEEESESRSTGRSK